MKKLQVNPPEKKKKTKSSSPPPSYHSSSPPSTFPSFSLLPDEITVNYLARISRSYYPRFSIVSKSFRSLLSSTELYTARSNIGSTEQCLYVAIEEANRSPQWFALWDNPNRILPNSSVTEKTISPLLVPIHSPNFTSLLYSSVAVAGSEIYVIGGRVDGAPSSAVRVLDCRCHTWRDAPSMSVAREDAHSCVYDGKIYALGGYRGFDENGKMIGLEDDEPWGEVFDTKTQTWECLPDPGTEIRKCLIFIIAEVQGKINFGNTLGNVNTIYAYDPKQGKWERCENENATFFVSECVVENVSYSRRYNFIPNLNIDITLLPFCRWYDTEVGIWKEVKGLESLQEKQLGSGDTGMSKLVSCGGKLLLIWEEYMENINKFWCAEIRVEKRDGGEVWGNVEWDDVVLHTIPTSHTLMHCLPVSV